MINRKLEMWAANEFRSVENYICLAMIVSGKNLRSKKKRKMNVEMIVSNTCCALVMRKLQKLPMALTISAKINPSQSFDEFN